MRDILFPFSKSCSALQRNYKYLNTKLHLTHLVLLVQIFCAYVMTRGGVSLLMLPLHMLHMLPL